MIQPSSGPPEGDIEAGYGNAEKLDHDSSSARLTLCARITAWVTSRLHVLKGVSQERAPTQTRFITRNLEACPRGYPMLATFQSSDRNFLQFRGFLDAHCRVLLDMQYDIERLERELDRLDRKDAASDVELRRFSVYSNRHDRVCTLSGSRISADIIQARSMTPAPMVPAERTRSLILSELRHKLSDYDDFVLKTRGVSVLQRPSNRDYNSLLNFFDKINPIIEPEAQWIHRREDIVTLRAGRESAGFDEFMEKCLHKLDRLLTRWCHCGIMKTLFMTPELQQKTSKDWVRYYDPERIEGLVNGLIAAIVLLLLIIPVVVMWKLSNMNEEANPFEAIGILIVFTLLFGGAMCSLTRATRQEIFAAAAAYCAVLVVFISNFTTQTVQIVSSGSA